MRKTLLFTIFMAALFFACTPTDNNLDHDARSPYEPDPPVNCYKYNVDGSVDMIPCPPE